MSTQPQATTIAATEQWLERGITLPHAVALILGYVIGASIFLLIGPLAGDVGPGLYWVYAMAAVPALFVCLYNIQLGAVMPTTGANYVAATRVLSPFAGFIANWAMMVAAFFGMAVLAYGFGVYLQEFIPSITPLQGAIGVVLLLGAINYIGISAATWVQSLMVLTIVAALAVFAVGGLPHMNPDFHRPLFPNGFGAAVVTAITAYFSYIGFTVITEVSGEIQRPRRNIPLALVISFAAILVLYMGTTYVFTGVVHWEEAAQVGAALPHAAARFLPPAMVGFIALAGLFATATTIHATLLTLSRDLLMLGRDGVLPAVFGRVHPRFHTPGVGIVAVVLVCVLGISLGFTLDEYALLAVLGLMIVHIVTATTVLLLPRRKPQLWQRAPVRYSKAGLWFMWIGAVAIGLFYLLLGLLEAGRLAGLFVGLMAVGGVYWFARKAYLIQRGVDLEERMKSFTDEMKRELAAD